MALVILLACLVSNGFAVSCYYPDGSLAPNDTPCSITATQQSPSFCCGYGYACLNNTICEHTSATQGSDPDIVVRGSCTDQTWASNACPKFCISNDPSGGAGMSRCTSSSIDEYCCNGDSNCSCATGEGTIQFAGQYVVETTIGIAFALTSTSTSTSSKPSTISSSVSTSASLAQSTTAQPSATSTDSTVQTSSSPASSSANNSIAIGVGVGVPLGLLAIGAFVWLLLRYQRTKKRLRAIEGYQDLIAGGRGGVSNAENGRAYKNGLDAQAYTDDVQQQQVPGQYELGDGRTEQRHELNDGQAGQRHELESRNVINHH